MNTANLENCKRLYELSGWEDGKLFPVDGGNYPTYSAGYLLRHLPETLDLEKTTVKDLFVAKFPNGYLADYRYRDPHQQNRGGGWWHRYDKAKEVEADTPEDALCLLAIKLFETGVLK